MSERKDKPKSGGKLGDAVALGIGVAAVGVFKNGGPVQSDETWWGILLTCVAVFGFVGVVTYLIIRLWDCSMARWRRSRPGER